MGYPEVWDLHTVIFERLVFVSALNRDIGFVSLKKHEDLEITGYPSFVRIVGPRGSTLVPWSNVRYATEQLNP